MPLQKKNRSLKSRCPENCRTRRLQAAMAMQTTEPAHVTVAMTKHHSPPRRLRT
jgi:hypothetical protein